tara:strand:- start:695 stop:868 length:174 start_codon:yes stop_codon:yes gene_type:complete
MVAVGCSPSDQAAIDKAVSATLAAQQGVVETAVASGLETAVANFGTGRDYYVKSSIS